MCIKTTIWCLVACLGFVHANEFVNLRGAGASFPSPVYKNWISKYKLLRQKFIKLSVSYDAIGSGSGKKQIMVHPTTLEYAGSDSVIEESDYEEYPGLQMYPVIAG